MQFFNRFVIKFVLLAPCILIIILIYGCTSLNVRTVSISETDIQKRIAKNLNTPINLLKIFDITLSHPIVKLDEKNGRLNTTLDADITNLLNKKHILGKFSISGSPRFDAASNTLILSDTKIVNFNIDGADKQFNKLVSQLTGSFGDGLLNEVPLFTVKAEDLKIGNRTYIPVDFKMVGDRLFVTLRAN